MGERGVCISAQYKHNIAYSVDYMGNINQYTNLGFASVCIQVYISHIINWLGYIIYVNSLPLRRNLKISTQSTALVMYFVRMSTGSVDHAWLTWLTDSVSDTMHGFATPRRRHPRQFSVSTPKTFSARDISLLLLLFVSVPNGTHDGRINCEHVCVRVGERNEKEKKSLVIKVKFKKSSTRLNG